MNNIPTYNSFTELALANGCEIPATYSPNGLKSSINTFNAPLKLHPFPDDRNIDLLDGHLTQYRNKLNTLIERQRDQSVTPEQIQLFQAEVLTEKESLESQIQAGYANVQHDIQKAADNNHHQKVADLTAQKEHIVKLYAEILQKEKEAGLQ